MMETVNFEDWQKLDLRVAEIKEVNDHPNADKLYILKVDSGDGEIQIVSGLKDYYSKNDLIGKKIIIFVNLKPVKIRGIESKGMLLAASKDEKVILLIPEKDIDVGARIS